MFYCKCSFFFVNLQKNLHIEQFLGFFHYEETEATQKRKIKKIIRLCLEGNTSLEISILRKRVHRTIKKFLSAGEVIRSKPKALRSRDLRILKNNFRKVPHSTSRGIFENAGISNVPKSTRNEYLREIEKV